MDTEVANVKTTLTQRRSRVNRNEIRGTRRRAKHRVENETNKGLGFGEAMLYSEKHLHEGKAQRQVYVEAHHEEVKDCELRNYVGKENFEWNTDLIDTKKLENLHPPGCTDLYS